MFDILAFICERVQRDLHIPCSTEIPTNRPERFVTVYRDGGGQSQHADNPTITVQTWGKTDSDAYLLALSVQKVMERMRFSRFVSHVYLSSMRVNNYKVDGAHRYESIYFLICSKR